ncbi:MAG: hypothetical protein IKM61_00875 [Eubacteriaceae bacterium]|nr:hypothetical protein [Eubacteriaceae bacterium]
MKKEINTLSLDTLCAALAEVAGIEKPEKANDACSAIVEYAGEVFGGEKADRVFMYNPDAVAEWIYEKYPDLFTEMTQRTDLAVSYAAVMPSVTPVCFGTMYTGAQPEVHGIVAYEKPVITIDTIFDSLIRAGKKPVIIAEADSSLSKIFLEREMEYYFYPTIEEVNAKAAEAIISDKYDFIVVYNGNYDSIMHKWGPEHVNSLSELRCNVESYAMFDALIRTHWKNHNSFVGFAMDHGAHEIDGGCGSHGLYMAEDINIRHFYKAYKAEK